MLEECGLPYQVHPDRHHEGRAVRARLPDDQPEQQDPGHRRPTDPTASRSRCWNPGAILLYLADKTGKFMPAGRPGR